MEEILRRLFCARFGTDASPTVLPLAGGGGSRRFFRVATAEGHSAVGVVGPDRDENRAFLSFSHTFADLGLPVPAIYGVDETAGVWLEEDLGDTSLYDALTRARDAEGGSFPASLVPLYRRVIEILPRFQVEGGRAVDYEVAHPCTAFDRQSLLWDLNYFKYHFLKLAHVPFHEGRLEQDFHELADFLLAVDTSHFLYRDFQSRNVMLRGEEPWFIDYQGGRRGALHYDVASLLYDAKADLPASLRRDLFDHYIEALSARLGAPVDRAAFQEHFRGYVLIRILQALGAYGYRGFYERKRHFLLSVPHAIANIEHLLGTGFVPVELPELRKVCERLCASASLRRLPAEARGGLTVHVGSFSYRRGYPDDAHGHGGGFVFDCRALPNPGRDPVFAGLSGLDPEVAAFLDARPEVAAFWDHVQGLVDAQVEVYRARGFSALSVEFGCTGGQHRSVRLAARLARHLGTRHPDVGVELAHAEATRWPETASRAAGAAPTAG